MASEGWRTAGGLRARRSPDDRGGFRILRVDHRIIAALRWVGARPSYRSADRISPLFRRSEWDWSVYYFSSDLRLVYIPFIWAVAPELLKRMA
jgi:hypothetical protein